MFSRIPMSLIALIIFSAPYLVSAQDLASFAGCTGTDCSTCNVVSMANGLIQWVIGFLFVLFAGLMAWAGFGLVTSNGNHHALDEAKGYFVNAVVGFIIILSAWLIIDTIMRGLVGNSSNRGSVQTVTGWLFWTDVQCLTQNEVRNIGRWSPEEEELTLQTFWPGDANSAGGTMVSSQACDATPAGNVNCNNASAACRQENLVPQVNTTNPTNHTVTCIQPAGGDGVGAAPRGSGSAGCSGGACVPLTIPCARQNSCAIASDMVSRLAAMHRAAGVSGARATEAMPPTRQHKSSCHNNGTCIDYSKAGGMSGAEVARVISAARQNGLRAVYEVHTESQKQALVSQGVPGDNIKVLGDWISAPHFSVYGD